MGDKKANPAAEKDFKVIFIEGTANHEQGNYDEAIEKYDQVIKLNPQFVDAYQNKGLALIELNRAKEAILAFDQALKLKGNDPDIYINKGNAYRELNSQAEAI